MLNSYLYSLTELPPVSLRLDADDYRRFLKEREEKLHLEEAAAAAEKVASKI